jgi:hypothetical protein
VPTATPEPVACINSVVNGNFESGATGWQQVSSRGYRLICTSASCGSSVQPYSGITLAWLGGVDRETSTIAQTVVLPSGGPVTLNFQYQIRSQDSCGRDYGDILVTVGRKTYLVARANLCVANNTSSWATARLNLSTFAGATVKISFQARTNPSRVSSFFVDDVSLVSGAACVTGKSVEITEIDPLWLEMEIAEDAPLEDGEVLEIVPTR